MNFLLLFTIYSQYRYQLLLWLGHLDIPPDIMIILLYTYMRSGIGISTFMLNKRNEENSAPVHDFEVCASSRCLSHALMLC